MTTIFLLFCLVFSISASTVIPGPHPKSSDLNVNNQQRPTYGKALAPSPIIQTVIPVDSQTFFDSEAKTRLAVIPTDSQTFFDSEAKPRLTIIPTDSQTFFDSEAKPRLTVIPTDSQTFFTGETKPTHVLGFGVTSDYRKASSDLTVTPVDSQTFFNSEHKSPHVKALSDTVKHPKPSGLTAIHIDSQTFFNHNPKSSDINVIPIESRTFLYSEPKPPHVDITVGHPKPSDINVIPIDSQTFFTSEPKPSLLDPTVRHPKSSEIKVMPVDSGTFFSNGPEPPRLDATVPYSKSSAINVMPVDSRTFFSSEPKPPHHDSKTSLKSEPKYKDSASYCSVYLKKENLKKGSIVCPFFAPPSPTKESSIRSICEHQSQEKEFKFCSSSWQDIRKKVMDKLGKNTLVSSARHEMNMSTITAIKKIAGYGQALICHKAQYVGFYCHQLGKSSVFSLSLTDLNGDGREYGNTFAVCHDDTTSWDRNRMVFKILKGKPGDAICHLLPSYDLVWIALI